VAPLIGISTSELRAAGKVAPDEHADPPMRELALALEYPRAVERAGAVPVIVPPFTESAIDPLLDRLDGLCLSGGPDIHPSLYGAEPHPKLGETDLELDLLEIELLRRADARGMPLLCICRGVQALNVARGGTLVQDLPTERPSEVEHRQKAPGRETTHPVRILADSEVAGHMGAVEAAVNSFHHQAIDRLGDALRAVAWAPDDVVEAVEATDRDFAIGVQWHAEGLLARPEQLRLYEAFLTAAVRFSAGRTAVRPDG
jgi:putative glutamine amidotransferase